MEYINFGLIRKKFSSEKLLGIEKLKGRKSHSRLIQHVLKMLAQELRQSSFLLQESTSNVSNYDNLHFPKMIP